MLQNPPNMLVTAKNKLRCLPPQTSFFIDKQAHMCYNRYKYKEQGGNIMSSKKYIENIVIGTPIVEPELIFALDIEDWEKVEKDKTMWTDERSLPAIMKELGIVSSISEVRRNKPHFCVKLEKLDYMEIKWGKRRLFILVGE